MGALVLAVAMADAAAAVQTVLDADRTAHGYPVESVQPGDAIVGYPEDQQPITSTFGRGMDRVTLPLWVICGLPQDVTTRAAVSAWLDDSASVVTAIEDHGVAWDDATDTYDAGTYDAGWASARVATYGIELASIAGTDHVVLKFYVDLLT